MSGYKAYNCYDGSIYYSAYIHHFNLYEQSVNDSPKHSSPCMNIRISHDDHPLLQR